ncbi:hypothetical protein L0F63_000780 [Massospora cicadina]|nr:hypothetical protein L0F63_000780 [Massospora cicadina]
MNQLSVVLTALISLFAAAPYGNSAVDVDVVMLMYVVVAELELYVVVMGSFMVVVDMIMAIVTVIGLPVATLVATSGKIVSDAEHIPD